MKESDWVQGKINIEFKEWVVDLNRSRLTKEGLDFEIFGKRFKKINQPDKKEKTISQTTKTILNFFQANPKYANEIVEAQDGNA